MYVIVSYVLIWEMLWSWCWYIVSYVYLSHRGTPSAVLRFPVRLFCRSAAIFSVGGNFGNHQPCIKNHFGLHVRLERYCLLWSRMYLYLSVWANIQTTLIGITDFLVWRLLIVRSLYLRFLKSDSDRVRNTCRTAHCLHALTDGSSDILCLFSVCSPSSWRRTQCR